MNFKYDDCNNSNNSLENEIRENESGKKRNY
jgi:hypothetical protein